MTTLEDLSLAYRKAKADLYYWYRASLNAIADHEDELRVKGGIADYGVISEIYIQVLLALQSSRRSPAQPREPVPEEFEIDFGRKVLPAGERE